jgi:hypothetical protein
MRDNCKANDSDDDSVSSCESHDSDETESTAESDDDSLSVFYEELYRDESEYLTIEEIPKDESTLPIHFAGGMDYKQCQRYYEVRQGGTVIRQQDEVRHSCIVKSESRSILRKACKTAPQRVARRLSWSGIPSQAIEDESSSSSCMDDAIAIAPRRVAFTTNVQTRSHPSLGDYSPSTKTKLWMSRQEMFLTMKLAHMDIALEKKQLEEAKREQEEQLEADAK